MRESASGDGGLQALAAGPAHAVPACHPLLQGIAMTPQQVSLVKGSWACVRPIQDAAADIFYDQLFQLDPTLRSLFPGDLAEQKRKLITMLHAVVQGLDKLDALIPVARELGRRHIGYGVRPEHYDTVGIALVCTLSIGLGDAFTTEVRQAWLSAYVVLAAVMKESD